MYTLIAYRPNGVDYCRGCHMGSSDSEFQITYHDTIESLAESYLEVRKQEFEDRNDREISRYEYTILQNGVDIIDIDVNYNQEVFAELDRLASEEAEKWLKIEKDIADSKLLEQRNKQQKHDLAELIRLQEKLGFTNKA